MNIVIKNIPEGQWCNNTSTCPFLKKFTGFFGLWGNCNLFNTKLSFRDNKYCKCNTCMVASMMASEVN